MTPRVARRWKTVVACSRCRTGRIHVFQTQSRFFPQCHTYPSCARLGAPEHRLAVGSRCEFPSQQSSPNRLPLETRPVTTPSHPATRAPPQQLPPPRPPPFQIKVSASTEGLGLGQAQNQTTRSRSHCWVSQSREDEDALLRI